MKKTFSSEKEKIACNRLLSKLAFERQVLGAHEAEDRSVYEDLSTGVTTQLPTEVEFQKKSNAMEVAYTQQYERCNIAYYTVNDVILMPSFLSSQCLFPPSSQCVTLGSSLFVVDIIFTYAHRICSSLHNLQIFLYLDPSVRYSDDRRKATQMTPLLHSKLQHLYSCVLDAWDDTVEITPKSQQLYVKCWNNIGSFR